MLFRSFDMLDRARRAGRNHDALTRFATTQFMPGPPGEAWRAVSPIDRLRTDAPPMLVIHGGGDVLLRVAMGPVSQVFGQPIVIDNRPSAGLIVGMEATAKSAPDGYTLCMSPIGALAISPHMFAKLPYVIERDFQPIAQLTNGPLMLAVSTSLPASSAREIVEYAKANPGKLSFASSGNGTITHLIGELFKARTGIDVVHVPYKTGVQAAPDLMEGRIQYMFDNIIWSLPMVREGKLKGLAITTRQRSRLAPDIPTVAESGVPGFEGITWLGLAVPAKTPDPVVERLAKELTAILAEPEVITKLAATGAEPPTTPGPEGMRTMLADDIGRWKGILSEGKIDLK